MTPGPVSGVIIFEETGETRKVTGYCRVCARSFDYENESDYRLVSPTGLAHVQSTARGSTDTACGKDAARDGWWWPL